VVEGNGESVGARVRRLRLERGVSQRDAAGPGVSAAYISRIEKGARRPSVTALRALARNLGVTPEYLETGSDLAAPERRDMRLADAELELRLGDDPGSSEATFRELLQEAIEAGDENVELRSRIGLGLAALHRGDAREAVSLLEAVVEHESVTPLTHPDVYLTLGRSYAEIGRTSDAVALFRDGLDEIDRRDPGNHTAYIRFATYLSYALADRGDLAGAQLAVADALARADDVADPYAKIRLYWSQARVAADQGQSSTALTHIRRAIALLETTEDTLHLGRAHLVSAEILLSAERLDDAERQLTLAEQLLGSRAEAIDLGVLRS
jgi:transcriptional regulator with XRE-family HTH domain